MPVSINGNTGVVTGLAVGGLPDGTVDADTLASNAVTAGKLASGVGGKILQVVNTLFTTPVTSTSNAYVNISGFEASITPAATTSKVLIMISVFNSTRNATTTKFKIQRSVGGSETDLRTHTGGEDDHMFASQVNAQTMTTTSYTHLDSPNTTSAITYKIYWKGDQTQLKAINRYDDSESYQGNSTITLMEVGA